jgi:hypothetical protein
MSSIVLWESPCGRVVASWNKQEAPSVFIRERLDAEGIAHGRTRSYPSEAAAIRAAKRWARNLGLERPGLTWRAY